MKYNVYSINDSLTGFSSPTLHNNDASAMRSFAEVFKDVYSPQDYSLFFIGIFDTDTGEFFPEIPTIICRATDFQKGDKDGNEK